METLHDKLTKNVINFKAIKLANDEKKFSIAHAVAKNMQGEDFNDPVMMEFLDLYLEACLYRKPGQEIISYVDLEV